MKINNFIKKFMEFYKDEFIYINAESLEYEQQDNFLKGTLRSHVPAYRRSPVKDLILTNTESMFCVNQMMYASCIFYYAANYPEADLQKYAESLLGSFMMKDMHFIYSDSISTDQLIPFTTQLNVKQLKNGYVRYLHTYTIGEQNNFKLESKGYLINKIMHAT